MGSHSIASSSKIFFSFFIISYMETVVSAGKTSCSSSCGSLQNIKYPFRFRDDPSDCGHLNYEFICEDNHTVFVSPPYKYYVIDLSYDRFEITLLDVGLARGNCSLPYRPLSRDSYNNFSKVFRLHYYSRFYDIDDYYNYGLDQATFISCQAKIHYPNYEYIPCLSNNSSTIYVTTGFYSNLLDSLLINCSFLITCPVIPRKQLLGETEAQHGIFDMLKLGFPLRWTTPIDSIAEAIHFCATTTKKYFGYNLNFEYEFLRCFHEVEYNHSKLTFYVATLIVLLLDIVLIILGKIMLFPKSLNYLTNLCGYLNKFFAAFLLIGRCIFAPLCLISFLAYKLFKLLVPIDKIERFLQNQDALSPSRYSYNEIVIITSNFKEKLGKGGFGSVFKGRLPGGYLVAVKILDKFTSDGDDFINEVSTIGRIHHVNVVQLVGFCAEGSYRALIYEYMANGSLDKYIFTSNTGCLLFSKEKLNEIALSVAKGLHYLHQGCDMRILHFDIKPQNILLDHDFTPKISDFGLAKLQPKGYSHVSFSVARGTIGYIAPEFISRSFGSISHKSDVYSFGMLLMDMAGGHRNTYKKALNSNDIYYPSWIYHRLQKMEVSENHEVYDIDNLERKLCIVGLWCIQTRPMDRPSMSNVVEMLEVDVHLLQMPPKPFFSSLDLMPTKNFCLDSHLSDLSIIS